MDRRSFCKKTAGGLIGVSMPGYLAACGKAETMLPPSDGITAEVAAVSGDNLDTMTRDAIDAVGGMKTIVDPGETVFVKPNFVNFPWAASNNCFHAGECTKPEIIIAIAEECLNAGAEKVIVGEGSHLPSFDWKNGITLDGSTDLVTAAEELNSKYSGEISFACLEEDSPGWIEIPSRTALNKIAISSLAANADKVISVPVAKTHCWAQLTLAAKNFLGITPLSRYAQLVDNSWWNRGTFDHRTPEAIAQVYLDIAGYLDPDLSIIDFSIGIEGDGPTRDNGGTTFDMKDHIGSWAIVASRDMMAADAIAAMIMDHNVLRMRHLTMGFEMGLGEVRKDSIEILGEKIDNLRAPFRASSMRC